MARGRNVVISRIELFASANRDGNYTAVLWMADHDEEVVESDEFQLEPSETFGGLNKATLDATDAGLDLEDADIGAEMTLRLKREGASDWASLGTILLRSATCTW